jgi:hypothetical protein
MSATFDRKVAFRINRSLEDQRNVFWRFWLYAASRGEIRLLGIPNREAAALAQEQLRR